MTIYALRSNVDGNPSSVKIYTPIDKECTLILIIIFAMLFCGCISYMLPRRRRPAEAVSITRLPPGAKLYTLNGREIIVNVEH